MAESAPSRRLIKTSLLPDVDRPFSLRAAISCPTLRLLNLLLLNKLGSGDSANSEEDVQ